ncbi:galactose-1-epimerase, partial [Acinetobacter baumannii]
MKKLAILGVTVYSFAQLANVATFNVKPYGTTQDGQQVDLYIMSINNGVSESFISFVGG